jgi:hypothetical protein
MSVRLGKLFAVQELLANLIKETEDLPQRLILIGINQELWSLVDKEKRRIWPKPAVDDPVRAYNPIFPHPTQFNDNAKN